MRQRLQDASIGALATGILVALSMFIIIQIPVAPYSAPASLKYLYFEEGMQLCPGDTFTYEVSFEILRPDVISAFYAFRDSSGNTVSPGRLAGYFPHPETTQISDNPVVEIPELQPGNYEYVLAITSENLDTTPIFVRVPFLVSPNCE